MTHDVRFEEESAPPSATKSTSPKNKRHKNKPFEWFGDPYNPVSGETSLWIAVITQAMMDALTRSTNSEAIYYKHEAIRWLTGNSQNFVTVCLFAGFDPGYIRRRAKRAMASRALWRAEAGKGKRYVERKAYRKRIKAVRIQEPEPRGDSNIIMGPWAF